MSSENRIHTEPSAVVFSVTYRDADFRPLPRAAQGVAVSAAVLMEEYGKECRLPWRHALGGLAAAFIADSAVRRPPIIASVACRRGGHRRGTRSRPADRLCTGPTRTASALSSSSASCRGWSCEAEYRIAMRGRRDPDGRVRLASRARLDGQGHIQPPGLTIMWPFSSDILRVRVESVWRSLATVLAAARVHRWKSASTRVGVAGARAGTVARVGGLE